MQSSYYPKYASVTCIRLEEELQKLKKNPNDIRQQNYVKYFRTMVSGEKYRQDSWDKDRMGDTQPKPLDKKTAYSVKSRKYEHTFVGHYDSELYAKQKSDYENGTRRSKPNGRRWCYLR